MSDSEEEDFCEYGTPLDPLDEDALPRKKPFTLEDQVVKDKQGRRRFHGAFTGGFSAGFYNTVGSLEGWTPSSFKSSRQEKASGHVQQKPEDFMDEEDMDEFGIAPKVLRAKEDFNERGQKRVRKTASEGPIPGEPVLKEILQPVRETVGIKLLKKMGWKPGQGVGPRVSKKEKQRLKSENARIGAKMYGCALPSAGEIMKSGQSSDEDDSENENISFAPDDYEPFLCKPKDNFFGIGYSGLDKRPVLSSHVNLFEPSVLRLEEKKKKVSISGQAFGVGAFEDEDEDIYSREDMTQYDFSLEDNTKTSEYKNNKSTIIPNYAGDVLDGFVLSSVPNMRKKHFPPPELPSDFQPLHVGRKSRFEPVAETSKSSSISTKKSLHNASDRAVILGETLSSNSAKSEEDEKQKVLKEARQITEQLLDKLPKQEFKNFRPFVADPDKQKRYEQYISLTKIGEKEKLSYLQPFTMTEWEKDRERAEFEQAAKLYRPLSGLMSDRFVSASQPDDATNPLTVVEKLDKDKDLKQAAKMKMYGVMTRQKTDWKPSSLLCKLFNIPEPFSGTSVPPTVQKKTVSRFMVFDYLDASHRNILQSESSVSDNTEPESSQKVVADNNSIKSVENDSSNSIVDNPEICQKPQAVSQTQDEISQKTAELSIEFPDPPEKIDLYKAIFLSSSEDSESDSDEESEKPASDDKSSHMRFETMGAEERSESTVNTSKNQIIPSLSVKHVLNSHLRSESLLTLSSVPAASNTMPARGVFANIDLDAINSRKRDKPVSQVAEIFVNSLEKEASLKEENENGDDELDEDIYGPKLPAISLTSHSSSVSQVTSHISVKNSDSMWVEKTTKKHDKKHKKSSKHKKHKTKKKKHKDKKQFK